MTSTERMASLRRVPMLATLDDASLQGLMACLRWRVLAAGDVLFREGDAGDFMVIVAEGVVVTSIRHAQGAEIEVKRVSGGGLVGEMACVDPAPRSATVTAAERTVVAELTRDGLTALRHGMPPMFAVVTGEVIRVVTQRLRELDARIEHELSGGASAPPRAHSSRAPPVAASQPPVASPRAPAAASSPPAESVATPRRGFLGFVDRLRGQG